ncbi:immunity repressor [Mycobacterium phage Malthus]|uniref:Immunity repressor n=6 Tax=Fionnbharthvirus TaxID=2948708 RepID=A0A6G6XSP4_9CAUD|nr:transcriptional repressor [Mycobacterium phage Fionnbharth]YP_009215645.1 transcriptional repressor [Mycobacterium phage Cheetobro]YP_009950389.1 transcriptional repressor [Mycobacterium phage Eponine]ALA46318.1 immunity repressor [Mycobacterium phage Slarp]ASR87754.1 immunity repressor [Mycobacterium phage Wintermute]ASW31744.1 immunity repressor [Mycobacterium phage Chancellor]AVR77361.1 immunity repressor [Mycobacterium phage SamScheppers]QGH80329.1 immunity repressor [Mycobacterium ph
MPMTDSQDAGRGLDTVLSYLARRRVTAKEIAEVLGISRSAYYQQRDEDRLITADNLIRAARGLGINEVDLLVRYGVVSQQSAIEYVEQLRQAQTGTPALEPRPERGDDELRHRPNTPPL